MSDVQFIKTTNNLRKAKLGSGPARLDPVLLERAEKAVRQMSENYTNWVEEDLGNIETILRRLLAAKDDDAESLNDLYTVAFDMKGQAGSFGFPLVSEIAASLAAFLEGKTALDTFGREVVTAHVSAIRAVIVEEIHDRGGETGSALIDGLAKLVAKADTA